MATSKSSSASSDKSGLTTDCPNGDEEKSFGSINAKYIGNFHKTLPHDKFGEVDKTAYETFEKICKDPKGDFEGTPPQDGEITYPRPDGEAAFKGTAPKNVAKLVSPQAGRGTEILGPKPEDVHMLPAPAVLSASTAAEMTELFWMAHLRDVPFDRLADPNNVADVIADIKDAYELALKDASDPGRIRLITDLPQTESGGLRLDAKTLFRTGLNDEDKGPLVSQFFLHDINYGAQLIKQTVVPYRAGRDYVADPKTWLLAQNTGLDVDGDPYAQDNDFAKDMSHFEPPLTPGGPLPRYRIRNMRDLARFVNRDALHQAYFNAALLLLNWGAPVDPGNPYNFYKRQTAFASLGGPNLLSLVSEVASRALKVVWRQKWLVHRRLRPEAYGGLMHMQKIGFKSEPSSVPETRDYGLLDGVFETKAAKSNLRVYGSYLLPIAFSVVGPALKNYDAGHASVADARINILKAWFDEAVSIKKIMDNAPQIDQPQALGIWQPADHEPEADLPSYTGTDVAEMTVLGELNKLASNVAMGRSMGGVHWRSDNTRSLRLGEQVATIILKRQNPTYAEQPLKMSYTNFDGNKVTIGRDTTNNKGKVTVENDQALTAFYDGF